MQALFSRASLRKRHASLEQMCTLASEPFAPLTSHVVCLMPSKLTCQRLPVRQTSRPSSQRPSAMRDTPIARSASAAASVPPAEPLAQDPARETTAGRRRDSTAQPAAGPSQVRAPSCLMLYLIMVWGFIRAIGALKLYLTLQDHADPQSASMCMTIHWLPWHAQQFC